MDFWTNPGILFAGAVILFFVALAIVGRRRPGGQHSLSEERERIAAAAADVAPRCICGEQATDPAPVLKRGRGAWDWLRNLYGAPPRYTREVDHMRHPVFCRAHVHVADALLDRFIFSLRSRYSELNAQIAGEAAGFEQEHLAKQVADSLTENQKRAKRSAAPISLRAVQQRTGTEDENT